MTSRYSDGPHVLAFGDSLTAGYGLARDEAFPARLQATMGRTLPFATVVNAGVSGDTSAAGLARLPRVLTRLDWRPDLCIVEFGANDLIRRVPPARVEANLDAIIRKLARCGVPVLLATFDPPAFLGEAVAAYRGIYERLARRHGVPAHPFFPPGIMGHRAHVLRDRMHPNAAAIARVAEWMLPAVLKALAKVHPDKAPV